MYMCVVSSPNVTDFLVGVVTGSLVDLGERIGGRDGCLMGGDDSDDGDDKDIDVDVDARDKV